MPSKGTFDALCREVRKDIVIGASQAEIRNKIMNKLYQIKYDEKTSYNKEYSENVIADVRREIKKEWKEQNKELRELQLGRLLDLYNNSRIVNDRITAMQALKEINKVTGLYEPDKLDVSISGEVVIDFGLDSDDTTEE